MLVSISSSTSTSAAMPTDRPINVPINPPNPRCLPNESSTPTSTYPSRSISVYPAIYLSISIQLRLHPETPRQLCIITTVHYISALTSEHHVSVHLPACLFVWLTSYLHAERDPELAAMQAFFSKVGPNLSLAIYTHICIYSCVWICPPNAPEVSCVARRTGAVKSMRTVCDRVTTACAARHQPRRTRASTSSNGRRRKSAASARSSAASACARPVWGISATRCLAKPRSGNAERYSPEPGRIHGPNLVDAWTS